MGMQDAPDVEVARPLDVEHDVREPIEQPRPKPGEIELSCIPRRASAKVRAKMT